MPLHFAIKLNIKFGILSLKIWPGKKSLIGFTLMTHLMTLEIGRQQSAERICLTVIFSDSWSFRLIGLCMSLYHRYGSLSTWVDMCEHMSIHLPYVWSLTKFLGRTILASFANNSHHCDGLVECIKLKKWQWLYIKHFRRQSYINGALLYFLLTLLCFV